MKAKWSVVAFHDGQEAQETAMAFCDQLVRRFWTDFDIEVQWWPFARLEDETEVREAVGKAAEADLIVFATKGSIPDHIQRWTGRWLGMRHDREGILVGLPATGSVPGSIASEAQSYLRSIAHRAGMDYLTDVPQSIRRPLPESLESVAVRAHEVTSVLDEILHRAAPPPRNPA